MVVLKPSIILPVVLALSGLAIGGFWFGMSSTPNAEERARVAALQPVDLVRAPMVRAPRFVEGDTASIAREIQKELNRVGCYDGAINGLWSARTRQSMKDFIDGVNARLPIDKPDEVLLSLVMGQSEIVCGGGPTQAANVQTDTQTEPGTSSVHIVPVVTALVPSDGLVAQDHRQSRDNDISAGATAIAAAAATAVAIAPVRSDLPGKSQPLEILQGSSEPMVSAARVVPPDAEAIRDDQAHIRSDQKTSKHQKRTRRSSRYKNKTPKYMRSFVRSVKGTLASFGIR
ncbi:MAG: hypothetical protein CTY31_05505 [Hyphomicrobium sp.]|nr:MAG: hypothetical protein CTY31_05505 [Hyphomicrobium sp.]